MRAPSRVRAVALLGIAALAPSVLIAQDHVNVTIVAPSVGTFPRLVAGSFAITNSDHLITHNPTGPSQSQGTTVVLGTSEPAKVDLLLPWGGELPQLVKAMSSGAMPSAIDHITCDFVHAGSNQPYYTVIIDNPLISHIDVVYDTTTATATEDIEIEAPQVEYLDGSTSSSTATASAGPAPRGTMVAGRPLPSLRVTASPALMRQIAASNIGAAGPPTAGFASFSSSASSMHFAPEGTFPAWATGAMANVESLSLTFDRAIVHITQRLADGTQQAVPRYGRTSPTKATFVKPVGSLSNDLQAAVSGRQTVTTTFELADTPGRIAYSIQFTNAYVSSDNTSMTNGHASEKVTVMSSGLVRVTNLRNNTTAQAP